MTFKKPNYLLLFIIVIGAALRFYGFPDIPFMYDEVSAWARTGFTHFNDLIDKGVKGDGHPAGIQVLLNYWRMLFGDSEASFKFPFLVMGVMSVWVIFLIGRLWFNDTVGYISAALVASLQYTVMYSQIARPYVSGLFFSLMMVWYWTNYFFNKEGKNANRLLAGFIFFAALCCYNHYFSILFAFIVGVTGLFFLRKENWFQYLVANGIIILLFLPHLSITFDQFSIGGVGGWLAKPGPEFFWNYLAYIFHFTWWLKGLVLLLIISSIIFSAVSLNQHFKFRLIALVWLLLPFFIGYFYSVYYNAVLQYSVLIFSFPYLLLFIFSWFKELQPRYNWLMVVLILGTGIFTLVINRQHYGIFYSQPVEQLVKNSLQTTRDLKGIKTTVLINEPRKYAGYYLEKFHQQLEMDYWAEKNFQSYIQFREYLANLSSDCFIAANIPTDYLILIKQFYPYEIAREKGFTYLYHAYSKKKGNNLIEDDCIYCDSLLLQQPGPLWKLDKSNIVNDSSSNQLKYNMKPNQEFSSAFSSPLQPLLTNGYNVVNVTLQVSNVKTNNAATLVVSFEEEGKPLFWQEKPFSYFMDTTENSGTIFYSISVRDLGFSINDELVLNTYVWNKNKDDFQIDDFRITIDSGNPWIYGLIEPIPQQHPKIF